MAGPQGTGTSVEITAGQITVVQNDIAALEGAVGVLETDMGVAQGNITTLQGDMTTAEGNITTAQGDIAALEGYLDDLTHSIPIISSGAVAYNITVDDDGAVKVTAV